MSGFTYPSLTNSQVSTLPQADCRKAASRPVRPRLGDAEADAAAQPRASRAGRSDGARTGGFRRDHVRCVPRTQHPVLEHPAAVARPEEDQTMNANVSKSVIWLTLRRN